MTITKQSFSINSELITAAQVGDVKAVQHWISAGADPHTNSGAAYVLAAANDHFDVVDYLFPLVNDAVRALGLEKAASNNNTTLIGYLHQAEPTQSTPKVDLNGIEEYQGTELGDDGYPSAISSDVILKKRLAHDTLSSVSPTLKRQA